MRGIVLPVVLDELDKKILHELCSGIYSYDDLAKTLNVTRGTVYRRIEKLESNNVIEKKIMALPNFKVLNLSSVILGVEVAFDDTEKVIEALKQLPHIKLIWKCYGAHNIIAVLSCEKGCEGETITNLRRLLSISNLRVSAVHVSIGFEWDKVDISPY